MKKRSVLGLCLVLMILSGVATFVVSNMIQLRIGDKVVLSKSNLEYYQDAYEIGFEKVIDTYAAATQHVDQGLSLTLFFKDTATTRDVNKAQIYAWRKGIKTLYYIRLRQMALEGTEVEGCVSCQL